MDLTKLSTEDLQALQAGDLSRVSTEGLRMLQQQQPAAAPAPAAAAPAETPSGPIQDMGTFERLRAGFGKALVDTFKGAQQLDALLADKLPGGERLYRAATGKRPADRRAELAAEAEETWRLDAPLMDTTAGTVGNIAGHVTAALTPGAALKGAATLTRLGGGARAANALEALGSSVMAPTTLRGAATMGAASGAVQPVVEDSERLSNLAIGGAAGAGGQAIFNALARVIRPTVAPLVQRLVDEGITPTPGQILGGGFKRAEEALTSVPIVGDAIKAGQRRAVADLNTAAYNRALAPLGEKLPKGLQGREAVDYVGTKLGQRYDSLLPKLTTQADGQFMSEVSNLQNMMQTGSIAPAEAARFESILQSELLSKFQPGANGAPTITGETMKGIERDLGNLASRLVRDQDADRQMVGQALLELQDNLRSLVQRSNPMFAEQLQKLNAAWANFKRVQRAAAGLGAEEGVFSPAQLQSAVKAADRSKDKARFARGDALMQDLSEPARTVLGQTVPDSGTPFRALTALGAGGAAGGLISPGAAAAVLAAPALYSRPGQNALAALLTQRPAAAEPVANALRRLAPYASVPAIAATQ